MAKILVEARSFNDSKTGEIIAYDFYGIVGVDARGKKRELPFKNLSPAEKIAFESAILWSDPLPNNMTTSVKQGGDVEVERISDDSNDSDKDNLMNDLFNKGNNG